MRTFDALILGAGGAGLMCALQAGRRGKRVLILDHNVKAGAKILISGGGRCNFTNVGTSPQNYHSENLHFAKSALSRYTPQDFVAMVREHGIAFHEKKLGQLFCTQSARDIVQMLVDECKKVRVEFALGHNIQSVVQKSAEADARSFVVQTQHGDFSAPSVVVATGGLSIPKLGATPLGFEIAKQFSLNVITTAPALDGFIVSDPQLKAFCELSGLSLDCEMSCNGKSFRENILFTHVGLSGPAALQCSLYWRPGMSVQLNLWPGKNFFEWAKEQKKLHPRSTLKSLLNEFLPARFVDVFCEKYLQQASLTLGELSEKTLQSVHQNVHAWTFKPSSTVGYQKAEVTRGGVDTQELSSKTLEAKKVPGLYFIGEVVDVTGWLGGYNFQWAWASGWSAAQAL